MCFPFLNIQIKYKVILFDEWSHHCVKSLGTSYSYLSHPINLQFLAVLSKLCQESWRETFLPFHWFKLLSWEIQVWTASGWGSHRNEICYILNVCSRLSHERWTSLTLPDIFQRRPRGKNLVFQRKNVSLKEENFTLLIAILNNLWILGSEGNPWVPSAVFYQVICVFPCLLRWIMEIMFPSVVS